MESRLSSRERVILSLRHREADRPGFSWSFGPQPPARKALDAYLAQWGLDYEKLHDLTCDIRHFRPAYIGPALPPSTSIWGWTNKAMSYGTGSYNEFDYQPLATAEKVEDIERHVWPSADHLDYRGLMQEIHQRDPEHRYARILWGGNPLETLQWMMGLERSLEYMLAEPQLVLAAMERITSYYQMALCRSLETARGEIDAVYIADDLGTQQGPMFSRATYREMVMPFHRRLCGIAHEFVPFVIHHSDGSVHGLLPDLIEAGVDCLEAVQVECADMRPEKLKADFGGRLAFQGGVSVQQVLPRLSAEQVRAEVAHLKTVLGKGGGYICAEPRDPGGDAAGECGGDGGGGGGAGDCGDLCVMMR